jgi:hypothetical protein
MVKMNRACHGLLKSIPNAALAELLTAMSPSWTG